MRTLTVNVSCEVGNLDDLHKALDDLLPSLPAGFRVGPWFVSDTLEA